MSTANAPTRLTARSALYSLLFIASFRSADCEGFAWSTQTQQCARMSGDESNIWSDQQNGFRWNFDLHVAFPLGADPDFMEKTVKVEFLRPLSILRVEPQGAVSAINGGPNWVQVEVTPSYVGHEYFSIQGFREGGGSHEDLLSPTITCVGGGDVPPPSPPHLPDCDLAPVYGSYPLGGSREAGSDVTIKLSKWTPFRVFTLIYFGQEGLLVSKPQGVTIVHNPQRLGNNLIGFTFSLDPQGSAGLRCEGHPACIEFEAKPAPHHRPTIQCISSPPPSPPFPPPHPLPPSPGSPPLPGPPVIHNPPPAPTRVTASASCPLGGSARIVDVHDVAGKSSVRIAVEVDNWIQGSLVTLGLDGDGLMVTRVIHATPQQQPDVIDDRSFTFVLGDEPVEAAAFAIVLQAQRWSRLVTMSCRRPSPPPPAVVAGNSPSYEDDAYGDDAHHSGSSTHSDAGSSSYEGGGTGTGKTDLGARPTTSGTLNGLLMSRLLGLVMLCGGIAAALIWSQRGRGLKEAVQALKGKMTGTIDMTQRAPAKNADEKVCIVAAAAAESSTFAYEEAQEMQPVASLRAADVTLTADMLRPPSPPRTIDPVWISRPLEQDGMDDGESFESRTASLLILSRPQI